tara:strand:+ start:31688 stop:32095 length:408 start_codon:yes stop_codon:yes gene_type:complete
MGEFFAKWMEKEAYSHPGFILSLIVFLAFGGGFVMNPFVRADDYTQFQTEIKSQVLAFQTKINDIDRSLCELKYSGAMNAIDQKIATVEAEVFQLQRREKSGEATAFEIERLDKQKIRLRQLQLEMKELQRRGCK